MKKGYHPKGLVWVCVKENNCLEMRNLKIGRFQHSIQSGCQACHHDEIVLFVMVWILQVRFYFRILVQFCSRE